MQEVLFYRNVKSVTPHISFLTFVISFLMFLRWKRTTTAKRSIETNLNELITAIWEIQIKWWSVSLNLGLVNICSYSIRTTTETFINLKQILEKKPWEKANLEIQFQQRGIKLKCSINKRAMLLQFYTNLPY